MCNRLIIAAAGSGKTTSLIDLALEVQEESVLITTYTEDNEAQIRKEIINKKGFIPANLTIKTWFSFLIQHGVRPYQSCLVSNRCSGLILVNKASALKYSSNKGHPVFYSESTEAEQHYFSKSGKIYSDKLSKFVCKCNEKANGEVISRISRVFNHIFIDEVQDLAGHDLEIIKALFESDARVLLVGDPRQVTYLTHLERKHKTYRNGKIAQFLNDKIGKRTKYSIDESTLRFSHRNNQAICDLASKVYPDFPEASPCSCASCRMDGRENSGIHVVKRCDLGHYLRTFAPVQLRWDNRVLVDPSYASYNFGKSKGLSFPRVLIYPTEDMKNWLKDSSSALKETARAKLYVAITRARYSVAFLYDEDELPKGIKIWRP